MPLRSIVQIDESLCDGCGACVPGCAEGAIQVIDGKARLVADVYCDGLGACLGHCPRGAITIVEREAEAFDEAAVHQRLEELAAAAAAPQAPPRPHAAAIEKHKGGLPLFEPPAPPRGGGCPGAAAMRFHRAPLAGLPAGGDGAATAADAPSQLSHWPVQLHLVPPTAPFLRQADLLLAADCAAVACPNFHGRLLRGRPVLIGCPKLDDGGTYVQKLAAMIVAADLRSITVAHMEVPCCLGLVRIAAAAIQLSGRQIPLRQAVVSLRGAVAESQPAAA